MTKEIKSPLMFPFSKDKVMFIKRDIANMLVQHGDNIETCAGLLKHNPAIVIVNDRQELLGTITNGDIRRLVERGMMRDKAKVTAGDACNKAPVYAHINDPIETLTHHFSGKVSLLPLVDSHKIVRALAYVGSPRFEIGKAIISQENSNIYSIAEIGVNHNGCSATAKELIGAARTVGFSAVKFQVRSKDFFTTSDFNTLDLGTQYLKKEIERTFLEYSDIKALIDYAKSCGLGVVCTPFDIESLRFCLESGVDSIKIASCDLTNVPLVERAASSGLPLIVSTGMSWEREIVSAYRLIIAHTSNFAMLHCNSTYPCPAHDVNLRYLERLGDLVPCIVGYSSHDSDPMVSALAVAKGARIIEVHITQSKDQNGTDHKASLCIDELAGFIETLRNASLYLGYPFPRTPSQGELLNRLSLGKSLCFARDVRAGKIVRESDLELRSPGNGLAYDQLQSVVGKALQKSKRKGELVRKSDVGIDETMISRQQLDEAVARLEQKGLISGVPVRYHDLASLTGAIPARFVEFHMSDSDLKMDPQTLIPDRLAYRQLYVHAVEQYSDGFILDFASADDAKAEESRRRFEQLIEHVEVLRERFNGLDRCSVIVNIGGFSSRKIDNKSELESLHKRAIKNLLDVDRKVVDRKIDLLLQTMPTRPWHQGGVAYHNLMVTPESINEIAMRTDLKVCLDISHSYLAATDLGLDIEVLTRDIAHCVSYLHISDASRLSQEGLQIAEGDIDLVAILEGLLAKKAPISFIPEIWNGHSNGGEGFKIAILRLAEVLASRAVE